MVRMVDLMGQRFGRLVVVGLSETTRYTYRCWLCRCDCGAMKVISGRYLRTGATQSCGCLRRENASSQQAVRFTKHGLSRSAAYSSWHSMLTRCLDERHSAYHRYAMRGITICASWLRFEAFYADMGDRPPGTCLERRDNDLGYFKENCTWATMAQQSRNKRNNRFLSHNGQRMIVTDWARRYGRAPALVEHRLRRGWTLEDALTKPPRPLRKSPTIQEGCDRIIRLRDGRIERID